MNLRLLLLPAVLATFAMLAGCVDPGYKAGELGNGGFYLSCDDAPACALSSKDAAQFPRAVALGATFEVRFEMPSEIKGSNLALTSAPDRSIVIDTAGDEFLSRGPRGLSAQKLGYATLIARDAAGQVIDYTSLEIARPDALVVYESSGGSTYEGNGSSLVTKPSKIFLKEGESAYYRALGKRNSETLAGSLAVEWVSTDDTVLGVYDDGSGTVAIRGAKAGNAVLVVTGATFEQRLDVVVLR